MTKTMPADTETRHRSPTPPRNNRRPPQEHRFEFRLTVPASDPEGALRSLIDTLAKILTKIWEVDTNARILPWYNNATLSPLQSIANIPTALTMLRQFFPRLNPNSRGGTRFSNIRIRSSLTPTKLKEDIDWYLRDNKHGLYLAQIQAEIMDTILWLLWSSELTDTVTLRQAIEAQLSAHTGRNIQVGLRWRTIQLESSG